YLIYLVFRVASALVEQARSATRYRQARAGLAEDAAVSPAALRPPIPDAVRPDRPGMTSSSSHRPDFDDVGHEMLQEVLDAVLERR
uniref:hypothetical protein n=1 Tax=Escherichia coli TaxID=562 RepID=UPI001952D17A